MRPEGSMMGREPMLSVLFLLHPVYIYWEPFRRVARALGSGIGASMLRFESPYLEEAPPPLAGDNGDDIRVRTLRVPDPTVVQPSIADLLLRFIGLLIGRGRIAHLLRRDRPDLVVIGVDVVDIYTRLVVDLCRQLHIPVLILAVVLTGPNIVNPRENKGLSFARLARAVLRMTGLERTVFFRGWVVGSYHPEAPIAVDSLQAREYLIGQGIHPERIAVTGDPLHDYLYELRQRPQDEVQAEVCAKLDLPPGSQVIAYCTECIQDVYGVAYLDRVNQLLRETFDALPADYKVVIKLHPRETDATARRFVDTFRNGRYRIVRDLDTYLLLRGSVLQICHYSVTRVYARLLGTPYLSIDMQRDQSTAIHGTEDALLRVTSENDLASKVRGLLFNPTVRQKAEKRVHNWIRTKGPVVDGGSANRAAMLIKSLLSQRV